jgi:hypothetical protein
MTPGIGESSSREHSRLVTAGTGSGIWPPIACQLKEVR